MEHLNQVHPCHKTSKHPANQEQNTHYLAVEEVQGTAQGVGHIAPAVHRYILGNSLAGNLGMRDKQKQEQNQQHVPNNTILAKEAIIC